MSVGKFSPERPRSGGAKMRPRFDPGDPPIVDGPLWLKATADGLFHLVDPDADTPRCGAPVCEFDETLTIGFVRDEGIVCVECLRVENEENERAQAADEAEYRASMASRYAHVDAAILINEMGTPPRHALKEPEAITADEAYRHGWDDARAAALKLLEHQPEPPAPADGEDDGAAGDFAFDAARERAHR